MAARHRPQALRRQGPRPPGRLPRQAPQRRRARTGQHQQLTRSPRPSVTPAEGRAARMPVGKGGAGGQSLARPVVAACRRDIRARRRSRPTSHRELNGRARRRCRRRPMVARPYRRGQHQPRTTSVRTTAVEIPYSFGQLAHRPCPFVVGGQLCRVRSCSSPVIGLQAMALQPGARRLTADPGGLADRRDRVTGGQPLGEPDPVVDPRFHDPPIFAPCPVSQQWRWRSWLVPRSDAGSLPQRLRRG